MARLPLDALQAMLIASIQALDVEKVQACLELGGERISRLDETHVYPAIWRAAHQAPGQDTEGRCERNETVAVILDKVCAAGLNPLSDNQLALAPYVVDWSNYRPPWSGLEHLVEREGFRTPAGGGWLHALCQNGSFNLRAILRCLVARGFPAIGQGGQSFWTDRDQNGLTPIELLWVDGGWEDRGARAHETMKPPGEVAVEITAWCADCGMNPFLDTPLLIDGMLGVLPTQAFQPATSRGMLLELVALWRRNRLSGYVGSKRRPDDHQGRAL